MAGRRGILRGLRTQPLGLRLLRGLLMAADPEDFQARASDVVGKHVLHPEVMMLLAHMVVEIRRLEEFEWMYRNPQ